MDIANTSNDLRQTIVFHKIRDSRNIYQKLKSGKEQSKKFLNNPCLNEKSEADNLMVQSTTMHPVTLQEPISLRVTKGSEYFKAKNLSVKDLEDYNFETTTSTRALPQLSPQRSTGKTQKAYINNPVDRLRGLKEDNSKLTASPRLVFKDLKGPNSDRNHYRSTSISDQALSGRDAMSRKNTRVSLNQAEKTISDLKQDTYRITEYAMEYKDICPTPNPAYDLIMLKDSHKRRNITKSLQLGHDISHLADLKAPVSGRDSIQKLLDDLKKETLTPSSVPASHIQHLNLHTDLKHPEKGTSELSDANINAFELVSHRFSKFLGASNSPSPRATANQSLSKEEISKASLMPNIRKALSRRFYAEDTSPSLNRLTYTRSSVDFKLIEGSNDALHKSVEELKEEASNELIQSLKKELPNVFTDTPSNRSEVLLLTNWLETNIARVNSNQNHKAAERLHKANEVYILTFNELIRQVSCECIERGQLFMRIWKNYLLLHDDILNDVKVSHSSVVKNLEEKHCRIQQAHQLEIELKIKEIIALKQDQHIQELSYESLKKDFLELETKHKNLDEASAKTKSQLTNLKKYYLTIKKECEDLSYKYNKLRKEAHGNDDEEFDPEDYVRNKLLAVQSEEAQSGQSILSRTFDIDPETLEQDKSRNQSVQPANFGNFQGKKIEWVCQETQVDEDIVGVQKCEMETQTELGELTNVKFDIVLSNKETLEELLQEEVLKRQIQKERVVDLEEDLHEAILEHQMKSRYKSNTDIDDTIYSSGNDIMETKQPNIYHSHSYIPSIQIGIESVSKNKEADQISYGLAMKIENKAMEDSIIEHTETSHEREVTPVQININSVESSQPLPSTNIIQIKVPEHAKSTFAINRESLKDKQLNDDQSINQQEETDQNLTLPSPPPQIEESKVSNNSAKDLRLRIRDKLKESELRRKSRGIDKNASASLRTRTDLKEIFEKPIEAELFENPDDSSNNSSVRTKYFEEYATQQMKYIRLSKMYNAEKDKVARLEGAKQGLTSIVKQDDSILDNVKEVVNDIRTETVDKGRLVRVIKSIEMRNRVVRAMRKSNFMKLPENLVSDSNNTLQPPQNVSKTEFRKTLTKTELSSVNTIASRVLDDEPHSERKKDGGNKGGTKKSDHKNAMLKANFISAPGHNQPSAFTATVANAPVLGKKRDLSTVKKQNPMIELTIKLRKALNHKNSKSKSAVTLKMVLKSVTCFYLDKIAAARENVQVKDQDMATFVYNSFLTTYGLSKFAESKYIKFMISVRNYSAIHRVNVFAKMCDLLESSLKWSGDEGKQYLTGLEYLLTQQNIGMTIPNVETEKRHYVPYVRAYEYAKLYCEKRNLAHELNDLKISMDSNKEEDGSGQNRAGKVKVDNFLCLIVDIYKRYKERAKDWLHGVFEASNFENNGMLSLEELNVLVKNIEPEKYDIKKIEELYNNYEDVTASGHVGIPEEKFIILALDNDMFALEKQRRFVLAADSSEVEKNFTSIKESWSKRKEKLYQTLDLNKNLHDIEIINFWMKALKSLDDDIRSEENTNSLASLMRYKLLTLEVNSVFSVNIASN